jgi:hypothetical protein
MLADIYLVTNIKTVKVCILETNLYVIRTPIVIHCVYVYRTFPFPVTFNRTLVKYIFIQPE